MSAPHADQIIEGYLARLEAAMADLPSSRRAEQLDDIRAHIAEARSRLASESDADLLNIIERLGDPTEIAAAARPTVDPGAPGLQPTLLEIATVALVAIFWPVGYVMLFLPNGWTRTDKIRAIVIPPAGLVIALLLGSILQGATSTGGHWAILGTLMGIGVVPIVSALILAIALVRRSRSVSA